MIKNQKKILFSAIGNEPSCWRLAWKFNQEPKKKIDLLNPFVKDIIRSIPEKPDGHQRELLKLILKLHVEDEVMGELWNICLNIWLDIKKQPSVRIKAYTHLVNIVNIHPELIHELESLTENEHINSLSEGIKKSTYKNLEKKIPSNHKSK